MEAVKEGREKEERRGLGDGRQQDRREGGGKKEEFDRLLSFPSIGVLRDTYLAERTGGKRGKKS